MAPQRQGNEEDTGMRPKLATSLGGETQVFLVDTQQQTEAAETPSGGAPVRGKSAEDDELTSLTWLQDCNLLQSIHVPGDRAKGQASQNGEGGQGQNDEDDDYELDGTVSGSSSPVSGEVYNPAVHIYAKPPYSFSCLIFMAIEDSTTKALPVKDIYTWILSHFPYFQNAPTGWKNSVRHNLSLNKCFLKVDKGQNIAKGSLWCIEPEYRPNLLQALNKTPYNQYRHLRLPTHLSSLVSSISHGHKSTSSASQKTSTNTPNPDLFPYLSKRLDASKIKDPEVDAAATMLALKNGPRILKINGQVDGEKTSSGAISPTKERRMKRLQDRTRIPRRVVPALTVDGPIITVSPSEDHTYSSVSSPNDGQSISPTSSIDEPFEFEHNGTGLAAKPGNCFFQRSDGDSGGDSGVTRSTNSTSDELDESMEEEDYYEGAEPSNRVIVLPVSDGDRAKSLSEQCYLLERAATRAKATRVEDEERKKIAEGADALLNLAGYRTSEAKPRRRRKPSRGDLRHLIIDEAQR